MSSAEISEVTTLAGLASERVSGLSPSVHPALAGSTTDRYAMVLGALALGLVGLAVFRRRPKVTVIVWFAVVCFVPTWLEVKVIVLVPPTTLVAAMMLVALTPVLRGRLTVADGAVGLLFIACLSPSLVGESSTAAVFEILMRWMVPFLLGRLLLVRVSLDWVYRCAGVAFTAAATLAIAEFFTGVNPFVAIAADNIDYRTWSALQERGGQLRVEGAFGHSIALGASMALALPLILASTFRTRTKIVMVSAILGAEVLTFSRIGILCSALALLLFLAFSRAGLTTRQRQTVLATLLFGAAVATPTLLSNFQRAGSEASLSAAYRSELTALLPDISTIGVASNHHQIPTGEVYFGTFRSIDNALILLGLTYGLIPLALAVVMLAALATSVVLRRATPAMIALTAQIPAVATVALITQYEMFFWFIVGLAVAQLAQRPPPERQPQADEWVSAPATEGVHIVKPTVLQERDVTAPVLDTRGAAS